MNVNIYRIDKELPLPTYHTEKSFGFDLAPRVDTEILPHSCTLVPSNLIIECPEGYALLLVPRSSLFQKKQLMFPHSIGLIDGDFCGEDDEIMIQVYNLSPEKVHLSRGERIAQGVLVRVDRANFTELKNPRKFSRGGFGSTGH